MSKALVTELISSKTQGNVKSFQVFPRPGLANVSVGPSMAQIAQYASTKGVLGITMATIPSPIAVMFSRHVQKHVRTSIRLNYLLMAPFAGGSI